MFTISVETRFRASHKLVLPDGSTEPAHEHDWVVTADVSSARLNAVGVVMDFRRLKSALNGVVAKFDNVLLNSVDHLRGDNPSAENVAKCIYEQLEPKLPKGVTLANITVVEEPGCAAKFCKGL